MRVARWAASALVAAGAIAGSLADRAPLAAPIHAGGYYILAADFHVHAFPGDGALPPWELAREARRRGLHAIVISNHNQTLAPRFGISLVRDALPILIPSQEVTTSRFHMIAAGVSSTIDYRLPQLELIRRIHEQGGLAIAAHPIHGSWRGDEAVLPLLDGAEIAHPLTSAREGAREQLTEFFTRAQSVNPTLAPIGSSDFHMVRPLAICRTYVFAGSVTRDGVLDALRAGRTVAQDQDGVLYGDPALTRLLQQNPPAAAEEESRALRFASVVLALVGALLLVG